MHTFLLEFPFQSKWCTEWALQGTKEISLEFFVEFLSKSKIYYGVDWEFDDYQFVPLFKVPLSDYRMWAWAMV